MLIYFFLNFPLLYGKIAWRYIQLLWLVLSWLGFWHVDCFHGDGHKPCIFCWFVYYCVVFAFVYYKCRFEYNSVGTATYSFIFMHIYSHLACSKFDTICLYVSVKTVFGGCQLVLMFQNFRFSCSMLFLPLAFPSLLSYNLEMCCSRKYPYPSHGTFFSLNPPPPLSGNSILVPYFPVKQLGFGNPPPSWNFL